MSEYNIQMNKYNALNAEYDQLYPVTKIEDVNGLGTALQKKADLGEDGKVPADQVDAYSKENNISASTRTALSLPETATPDAAFAKIAQQLSDSGIVRMVKLWENSAPTSTFPAQKILANISDCDFLIMRWKFLNSNTAELASILPCKAINGVVSYVGNAKKYIRNMTFYSDGISFADAFLGDANATSLPTDNSACIPLKIYSLR